MGTLAGTVSFQAKLTIHGPWSPPVLGSQSDVQGKENLFNLIYCAYKFTTRCRHFNLGTDQSRSQSPAGAANKDLWGEVIRHDRILGLPVLLRRSGGSLYPRGPCCLLQLLDKGNEDSWNEIGYSTCTHAFNTLYTTYTCTITKGDHGLYTSIFVSTFNLLIIIIFVSFRLTVV